MGGTEWDGLGCRVHGRGRIGRVKLCGDKVGLCWVRWVG